MDFTYIDNVIHGHILAAEHLQADSPLRGKVWESSGFMSLGWLTAMCSKKFKTPCRFAHCALLNI